MTAQLHGYDLITKLYESSRTVVYRAQNHETGRTEILKMISQDAPSSQALARYRHEFEIGQILDAPGIIDIYRLETFGHENKRHGKMLVMEDIGATSLAEALSTRHFDIDEFLEIAIQAAEALGQVHAQGVIHKDVTPSNIIWNPQTGQLKLIDFGISTSFTQEWPSGEDISESVGTLAYMSPEQTGRTNRRVDYRSDFYSLGGTFYELLTGQCPCEGEDDVELFHCHLARAPRPPIELRPDVPAPVSKIIIKLLAKPAEDRYQSAHGLVCDLRRCLEDIRSRGSVRPFDVGADDVRATLQISQKLYGRKPQLERLLGGFERAASGGSHLLLITGKAGVGKSSLVRESRQVFVGRRARFVAAKFDQNEHDVPYSAFTDAFDSLLSTLLALPADEVVRWRARVQEALESNGALLADIAPRLSTLVGRQTSPPAMAPDEARHRLARVVRRFVQLFCEPDQPLTIFLDDLQWADPASMDLMTALLTDERVEHLLLIGAYRDDEVTPAHRLSAALERLEEAGAALEQVQVEPLRLTQVQALVADTVQSDPVTVSPLAKLVHRKTSGNPYFVNRFLENLYAQKLLWFDAQQGTWCWDLEAIHGQKLTDNVVALLIEQLCRLPKPAQQSLQMAALLGVHFQLDHLATVCEAELSQVYEDLLPALESGVVLARSRAELSQPGDSEAQVIVRQLAFAHDRVQEAAAQLMDAEDRPAAHFKVGRLLQCRLAAEDDKPLLFDVVSHLDEARDLIEGEPERLELARLNVEAARRAMASLAFATAGGFLEAAQNLLGDDIWQLDAELAFEVFCRRAESASLDGQFELAEQLFDEALDHLDDPIKRARIYTFKVRQYTNQAAYQRGRDTTARGLAELGIAFDTRDLDQALAEQFSQVRERLGGKSIRTITDVPRVDHPTYDAALQLLGTFQPAAGLVDPRLLLLVGLKAIELSLEVGVRALTAVGLGVYGLVLLDSDRYEEAYEAGELSMEIAREFQDESTVTHAALVHGGMTVLWSRPLDESIELLDLARQTGMRSGNLQLAGFAALHRIEQRFTRSDRLTELAQPLENVLAFGRQTKNRLVVDHSLALERLTRHLRGELDDDAFVDGRDTDWGEDLLETLVEHGNDLVETSWRSMRGFLNVLYARPARALEDLDRIDPQVFLHLIGVLRYAFYKAMAHAQRAHELDAAERAEHIEALVDIRERFAIWAQSCAANFEHHLALLDAEVAWLTDAAIDSPDRFDHAIELAKTRGHVAIEALACERAASLWMGRGKPRFAQIYLRDALRAYRAWGARRKVQHLRARHPELLTEPVRPALAAHSTTSSTAEDIDITSVFRAAESIARHIQVDEMLTTLMEVTIANAGAQHGAFFLGDHLDLSVAVEGQAECRPRLVEPPIQLTDWSGGARSVVRFVARTGEAVVLARASADARFHSDPYVVDKAPRSVLCLPVEEAGESRGILYLENNLTDDAFTEDSVRVLKILAGHIAVSLSKAKLYEAVHLEKERFRQLAEHIHEVFWLMNWPSKDIVYVSPAYTTTWGRPVPHTPLSVDDWLEAVIPDDLAHVKESIQTELSTGEYDIIYQIERPSGSRRWIRDRGFPIRREDGQTYRIAGVAEDITRQHEVEQMKDEFISVVSHELRTPLTPIKGIFEILGKNETIRESVATEKMVELGLRNSRRLLRLIDDLLDIQKLSLANISFEFERIELADIVTESLQINEPLGHAKNIKFVFDVVTPGLYVEIDRARLVQVLTNLLSNAVKFSDPSDTIEVAVTRCDDHACISVTDHGSGIPEEARERVFEKFVQADSSLTRKHGGAGLGLAISRAIVERLGGKIHFESEIDVGTTFYVELPLVD